MDLAILVLAALSVGSAVFFFGGVTQPEFGFCLIGLGLAAALYWLFTPKYKRAPADPWLTGSVAAVVLWTIAQALWFSIAPLRTSEYIFTNAAIGTMLLLARELGWRFRRKAWIAITPLLVVAGMEGALGLLQFLAMRAGAGAADSATGTYPNRNHFAGLLEMALPLAVAGGAAFWRGRVKRWWGAAGMWAVAALLIIGTVISLSRMGFLAALTGLFVLGVLLFGGGHRRWTAIAAVGVALVAAFIVLPTDEWVRRFATIAQTEDLSADSRAQIWRDTLPMVRDHAITGVGMGAYESAFYKYKNVAPMGTVDYAHNDYLQLLAELGLIGFAFGAFAIGRCLYWMAKGLKDSTLVAGAWGAVAAIAMHSLVDFNMYIPANALVLAWILGAATAPAMTEARRATSE